MIKYRIYSSNCFIDGVYSDFSDDNDAADFAANYEADAYRINSDGSMALVYHPE